jgi:hypothetical protein
MEWGFDETTLDGVSTLNQWAMLEFAAGDVSGGGVGNGVTIVTLKCAGALTLSLAASLNLLFIFHHPHLRSITVWNSGRGGAAHRKGMGSRSGCGTSVMRRA